MENSTHMMAAAGPEVETPPRPEELNAVIIILSILSVFGAFGNGLVLYVFSRKVDKVTSTIFILALAITDLLTCLVTIPLTVVNVLIDAYWKLDFFCKFYQFSITCNVPLSAFIMVAIAVDRYFSICHPFKRAVTPLRAKIAIFCLALFSFSLGTFSSLTHGVYKRCEGNRTERTEVMLNGSLSEGAAPDVTYVNETTAASSTSGADNATSEQDKCNPGQDFIYSGVCAPSVMHISQGVSGIFQYVFASFYLISLLIVLILYTLIYRSVVKRRQWRWRQKSKPSSKSAITAMTQVPAEEVELCTKNGVNDNNHDSGPEVIPNEGGEVKATNNPAVPLNNKGFSGVRRGTSKEKKDYNLLANIRTAAMLFVVTVVFIIAFLPAWLMAVRLVTFNIVVFYMYFCYNVANPVIYAFMNVAFRKELKTVFHKCFGRRW